MLVLGSGRNIKFFNASTDKQDPAGGVIILARRIQPGGASRKDHEQVKSNGLQQDE
jgi:hypothetical protein